MIDHELPSAAVPQRRLLPDPLVDRTISVHRSITSTQMYVNPSQVRMRDAVDAVEKISRQIAAGSWLSSRGYVGRGRG
ncbi:MAG: hypothetical protein WKF86_08775, partial [Acidimicrobiales bacterium]